MNHKLQPCTPLLHPGPDVLLAKPVCCFAACALGQRKNHLDGVATRCDRVARARFWNEPLVGLPNRASTGGWGTAKTVGATARRLGGGRGPGGGEATRGTLKVWRSFSLWVGAVASGQTAATPRTQTRGGPSSRGGRAPKPGRPQPPANKQILDSLRPHTGNG